MSKIDEHHREREELGLGDGTDGYIFKENIAENDLDKILYLLGKYYDEWTDEDDWWYGLNDCDINVHQIHDLGDDDYKVDIYGVEIIWGDDGEQYLQTNTNVVLDEFIIQGE